MYNVPLIITVVGIICVVAIVIFVRLYIKRRTSIPRFIRRKTRRNTDSHHQNVPMSLQLCLDDYLTTGNAEMLIVCGDVYRSGVYPLYRGNPAVAEMCYRTAALLQDTPENTSVRALGLTRLLELTFNEIQPVDVPSINTNFTLPEQPGIMLCELVESAIRVSRAEALVSQRHRSPDVRVGTPNIPHTKEYDSDSRTYHNTSCNPRIHH